MAITTTTIYAAAGYARTDVINQIESAFNWLGFNAGPVSGMVTMQSGTSGGGTVSGDYLNATLYNLPQKSTSGSGTGATFDVQRSNGNVYRVRPNRPGSGYAQNNTVTIDAADMGTGATDLIVTVQVDGNASPTAYGSATTLFHKENAVGTTYPYGVTRHTVGVGKTYGDTYRVYKVTSDTRLQVRTGSSFSPFKTASQYEQYGGYYLSPGFRGDSQFDMSANNDSANLKVDSTTSQTGSWDSRTINELAFASSNTYPLQLNVYRSAIDTKFAVISFREGTKPATTLEDNTYFTWFVHNYESSLFDYDYLFQGGLTRIYPDISNGYEELHWNSYYGDMASYNHGIASKRSAEAGFSPSSDSQAKNFKETIYSSNASTDDISESSGFPRQIGCYYRDNTHDVQNRSGNGSSATNIAYKKLEDATNYNAVIKGLPINAMYAPCPYYIPDDFALIQFDYATPGANIQQGDTVTISGSEVWTVIQGSYTQTTRTRGVLFCARTT